MNKVASFLILLKYINIKREHKEHTGPGGLRQWQYSIVGLLLHTLRHIWGAYIRSYFGWRCLIGFLLSAAEGFAWWTCTLMSHTQKKIAVESKADNGSSSICLWNIALAMLTSDEISRTSVTATKRRCCLYECVCVCVTLCVCVCVCSQWTQD